VAHTVGLALAAAIYPTILAGVIVILAQPNPRRLLLGFLLGGMAVSIACGVLIVDAIRTSNRVVNVQRTTRPLADIVLGLLCLSVAWMLHTGRGPRPHFRLRRGRTPKQGGNFAQRVLGRGSLPLAVFAGAVLNLPGIWYLAALTDIAEVTPVSSRFTQIVVFNLIMFVLVEVPLLLYLFDEERARRAVAGMNEWMRGHKQPIALGVAVVVGGFLLVKGVVLALD